MNDQSERFLRQLLLHRYAALLTRVRTVYNVSDEDYERLQNKILNIHWFCLSRFAAFEDNLRIS